ncbi:MAG: glycosyltransferase [Bacteroidota bacterium]|nr:glycosyltransferase family 4 protein [Candidatus Kapabacteria bacterium]MDW8219490.1 glycosyltransferase [Bacteroidota bacterium]
MTRLLMLWARYPFPPSSGRAKLLAQRLAFCSEAACEVYLVILDTASPQEQAERTAFLQQRFPFVKSVWFFPLPSLLHAGWNMLQYAIFKRSKTLQESLFFTRQHKRRIYSIIAHVAPHTIYCDTFRTAQYLEHFAHSTTAASLPHKPHIVFDWDDIFSQKYQNYLERSDDNTPLLGYLSRYVPLPIQALVNRILRRTLLSIEIKRSLQRETFLPRHADVTLLVSPREVETLQRRSNTITVYAMLPAVHIPQIPKQYTERPYSLVFMGLLNFMPNEEGLVHFLRAIFPYIVRKLNSTTLTIIGAHPTQRLLHAASRYNHNITFTGYLTDPAPMLCSSQVFIAPVHYGTGIKTKILDAMAYRVPVVTTPQGAEGLHVQHGRELMIASTDAEFADACLHLMCSPDHRNLLRIHAFKYVRSYHSEEELRRVFLHLCRLNQSLEE